MSRRKTYGFTEDIVEYTDYYYFSEDEIKWLVELTKEPSYTIPRGLTREERRKYISDLANKILTQNSEEGEKRD